MKTIIILLLPSIFILAGCGSIQDTIYLQDIEVNTPMNVPPINLTSDANKGKVTISPKFYFNDVDHVEATLNHSPVNGLNEFEVDTIDNRLVPSSNNRYTYPGRNIRWNIPELFVGVDLDIPVSEVFSVNAGFNVSSVDNTELLGGSLGVSIYKLADNSAIRFSGGLAWQQYQYYARTVVIRTYTPIFGDEESTAYFFDDNDKESEMNFYLSLLYNSNFPEFPVNIYMGVSYFRQTLFDFEPANPDVTLTPFYIYTEIDARGEYSGGFFNFSPGIFKDISDWARIVGGVNYVLGTAAENSTESSFLFPFIKFEFFL